MAKVSSVEKNNLRKRLALRYAAKRARLKAIAKDQNLRPEERFAARLKLAELPRNSSPNRYRNRCELTGRARGYHRKVRMSRMMLRELAGFGLVPGMVKASW